MSGVASAPGFEPTYEGLKLSRRSHKHPDGVSFEPTYEGLKLKRNEFPTELVG